MAYPGVAFLAMVGIGLGFALWYFWGDGSSHREGPHSSGARPPRSPPPSDNSWGSPKDARRRCRKRIVGDVDDECSICTEPMSGNLTQTKCGHSFHSGCLEQWRKISAEQTCHCPLCRQPI